MSKSNYLENKVLDHCMGKTAFTMPSTVYAALCVNPVTDADTGSTISEASYTGYARILVDPSDLNAATDGEMTNAEDLVWPDVEAGTDVVVAIAFCDAATGGNVLYYDGDIGNVEVSTTQSPPTLRAGALVITED